MSFRYRGQRIRKRSAVQTKRGAEAFERSLRNELVSDEEAGRDPFAGPPPTFAEFAERWMRDYVAVRNRPSVLRDKGIVLRNAAGKGHARLASRPGAPERYSIRLCDHEPADADRPGSLAHGRAGGVPGASNGAGKLGHRLAGSVTCRWQ